jgi:hypothetical protein
MAQQHPTSVAAAGGGGLMAPVIVLPIAALVLIGAVIGAQAEGYSWSFPIDILGGFSYRVAPLMTIAAALIIAFGLWRYGGMSQGWAWVTAICLFLVPNIASFMMNYLTGVLLANLSDAAVTNSQNFYFILFLKAAVSAASVLLVMAIASRRFRHWTQWLYIIVLWAGGDTLLFALYRDQVLPMNGYMMLYPVGRALGFIVIGYQLQRPARVA